MLRAKIGAYSVVNLRRNPGAFRSPVSFSQNQIITTGKEVKRKIAPPLQPKQNKAKKQPTKIFLRLLFPKRKLTEFRLTFAHQNRPGEQAKIRRKTATSATSPSIRATNHHSLPAPATTRYPGPRMSSRISQLTGHPALDLIPHLAAQGLGPRAIAARLSERGPKVTPSAVENRLKIMDRTARKIAAAVALPSNITRPYPALSPAALQTLPAVESFVAELTTLGATATRLLQTAEDSGQLNAAAALIGKATSVIRTKAELSGVLSVVNSTQHHQQVVIVLGSRIAESPQPAECRELGAADAEFLDSEE